jgi:prepilin-type N-terminal cleavage/methylation domain-containing protein
MREKGFTLIELLVVIAIIAILAAIVLVSVANVRNRSYDSRVESALNQIRTQAEIVYEESNPNAYTTVACAHADINPLCVDINSIIGANPTIAASANAYCAESVLKSSTSEYWCTDSTGRSKKYTANPACSAVVGAEVYACE